MALDRLKFWSKQDLSSFDHLLTRERLIQAGRIIIIDDEEPLFIQELKNEGFAVDHDRAGDNLQNIESQIYDVAIIDYHGVGQKLGAMQGLDLIKHIGRVSPRTRLVAYTSRSLSASESDFFRLSHAVLPKDLGLGDSLALVEDQLKKAFSKEHLFDALLTKLNVSAESEKKRIRDALTRALSERNESKFRDSLTKLAGQAAGKAVEIIISKLFFTT
jgi:DNA-binding NarL/FixJ family response regulator